MLHDEFYWNALGNMVFYVSSVIVQYAIAFGLAMLLNAEIRRALQSPEIGSRLSAEGSEPGNTTPAEFAAYIRREIDKWRKVVQAANIRVE